MVLGLADRLELGKGCAYVWREGITPNQNNTWHMKFLGCSFCAGHTSLSFPWSFHRQNNRGSVARCKILVEDAGFWIHQSTVWPRCMIGLENFWTSEIDVEQEICGEGMKVLSCVICCMDVRVWKWYIEYREWYTSGDKDASKWGAISSLVPSEMRSVVCLGMVSVICIMIVS